MNRSIPLPTAALFSPSEMGVAVQKKMQAGLQRLHASVHRAQRLRIVQSVGSCLARQDTFTLATLGYGAEEIVTLRHEAANGHCNCPWC